MKNSIIIFLLFNSLSAIAQGDLKFNQVLNLRGPNTNGSVQCGPTNTFSCNSGPIFIVPENKVWKIESSNCNGNVQNIAGQAGYWMSLKINGTDIIGGWSSGANGFLTNGPITFPIWLNSGSTLQPVTLGAPTSTQYFISVIEFNVVNN